MKNIPAQHNTLMPYLMLGNAGQFFSFMEKIFGATQQHIGYRDDGTTIMHAEIRIDEISIMYCQANEEYPPKPGSFFIYVDNADERYRMAIEAGAVSIMPPADQSYGRSCGITDPFGNIWWITSL